MLAARAEGVGSALTTLLGAFHHGEVLEILDVPGDGAWRLTCCVSFGYPTGRWGVAPREPAATVTYRNRWLQPPGLTNERPRWPDPPAT